MSEVATLAPRSELHQAVQRALRRNEKLSPEEEILNQFAERINRLYALMTIGEDGEPQADCPPKDVFAIYMLELNPDKIDIGLGQARSILNGNHNENAMSAIIERAFARH